MHPGEWVPARSSGLWSSPLHLDVAGYLTLWLVLLYLVSARQIIGPLGAIGQPALLVALAALVIWVAGWLLPQSGLSHDPHPLRSALLVYLGYAIVSYAIAMSRPLTGLEFNGAHRALVLMLAMTGVGLLIADGVRDNERLTTLLRRLVIIATLFSVVGIVQFLTGAPIQFRLPGLIWQGDIMGVGGRSIFNRPASMSLHPIEFSVVTATLVPLAIHYALYESSPAARHNLTVCAGLIAFAMPLAISRTGILSLLVGLAVLGLGWNWRRRLYALVIGAVAVPLLWLVVPGLVGTLRSLFRGTDHDPSIQARLDRVPRIMEMIREYPWFGRGNGTWSVEDYFLVDNELWVTTIEMGVVGIVLTFTLLLLGIGVALSISSLPAVDEATGHLGRAIGAAIAALGVSLLTFDAFHYRILTGTLFLLLGAAGALWRLNAPPRSQRYPLIWAARSRADERTTLLG